MSFLFTGFILTGTSMASNRQKINRLANCAPWRPAMRRFSDRPCTRAGLRLSYPRCEIAGALAVGLLDELEQEAQRRLATAGDAQKRKAEREETFRTQIEPGMTALYEYLQKLTASLKVLKPKKQQRYALTGYG